MAKTKQTTKRRLSTTCVHTGVKIDHAYRSVTTPIYPTSNFEFISPGKTAGFDYTRSGNPTRSGLEESLAALEGGVIARATSSGMSAIATVSFLFAAGDQIIAGNDIYGGTFRFFEQVLTRHGISISFVDMREPRNIQTAITKRTKAVWIETPSNPLLNLVDIKAVTAIAKRHKLLTICDNTFASPILQRPFALGVDLVVHSTTKYLNGHSDVVGGAIVARTKELGDRIAFLVNALGTACSPFDAFLVLRGIKTLPQRMLAHVENAIQVAEFLNKQRQVAHVYYPGLKSHPQYRMARQQMLAPGAMISFDIKGGLNAANRFVSKLKIFSLAESLGGVESLVELPWTMSHASMSKEARERAGINPGCIRLSIGIESAKDLIADLKQALFCLR